MLVSLVPTNCPEVQAVPDGVWGALGASVLLGPAAFESWSVASTLASGVSAVGTCAPRCGARRGVWQSPLRPQLPRARSACPSPPLRTPVHPMSPWLPCSVWKLE